jgi:TonB family protein
VSLLEIKHNPMKPIVHLLINIFLGIASSLFAQTNSTQVQTELEQIKSQKGVVSFAYVEKSIALAQTFQREKNFEKALGLDKKIRTIIKRLSKKAPQKEAEEFKQQIENLFLEQEYTYWQGLMLQEDYTNAQAFLTNNNWIRRCVYNKSTLVLLSFFELAHQKIGSEHLTYLNNWEIAYLLFTSKKYRNEDCCEKMWQSINKHRIAEGGQESPKHLEVLFGYASFCKRTGNTVLYERLKTQVKKHWPFAFKKPSSKIDNPNTNVSPSIKAKEESSKNTAQVAEDTPDEMPRFPGCENSKETAVVKKRCADQQLLKFIYTNIEYPANTNYSEEMAMVSFTVTQYGTITEFKLVKDPGYNLGPEALRVVQLMAELPRRWKAGMQRGKAVDVTYRLPIRFKLS